ncbi:hypothetical protein [Mucilaginibacter ginkgonis]|uniref:Uncharacterized protein n=1 Tax=Mucilaginibacter ginkgonis TaxID=2682091 RepID=A0A6I4HVG7_9SPHI|nr:hypothetical protein [Mucilaginibacter ginkgonis]QQL49849.1 hypothetical protein GO620_017045 [Mucilaginibacter ginkgonis]
MKHLKFLLLLAITACTFASADAQIRVSIGKGRYYHNGRHYHHRAPYMRNHHRYYRYW